MELRHLNLSISLSLAVCLCSCATKEQTYWEKAGKRIIIVHHVRKVNGGLRDHVERLTSTTVRPAEIHVYDLGRMPDGQGGMHAERQGAGDTGAEDSLHAAQLFAAAEGSAHQRCGERGQ